MQVSPVSGTHMVFLHDMHWLQAVMNYSIPCACTGYTNTHRQNWDHIHARLADKLKTRQPEHIYIPTFSVQGTVMAGWELCHQRDTPSVSMPNLRKAGERVTEPGLCGAACTTMPVMHRLPCTALGTRHCPSSAAPLHTQQQTHTGLQSNPTCFTYARFHFRPAVQPEELSPPEHSSPSQRILHSQGACMLGQAAQQLLKFEPLGKRTGIVELGDEAGHVRDRQLQVIRQREELRRAD